MVFAVAVKPAIDWAETDRPLAALLGRVARGEESALAQLYDSTCRVVYGLILRITGDAAAAEEIAMEVYLQVWRTAANYSPERGTVSTWLVMLARSRAIDWLRSRHGQSTRREDSLDDVFVLRDPGPDPEAASLDAERSKAVRRAISGLPEEQREALQLAYFQGLSHSEIAARQGLPLGTIKTRIRLGTHRLRDALGLYAGGM